MKKALRGVWNELYNTQRKVDIIKTTYLEDLVIYKSEQYGTKAGDGIKNIIHIEAVTKKFKIWMVLTRIKEGDG